MLSHRQEDKNAAIARRVEAGWRGPPGWSPDWVDVRGLKRCANRDCPEAHSSFHDRDANAARNILAAFEALDRGDALPAHMVRKSHKESDAEQHVPYFRLTPHARLPAGLDVREWGGERRDPPLPPRRRKPRHPHAPAPAPAAAGAHQALPQRGPFHKAPQVGAVAAGSVELGRGL